LVAHMVLEIRGNKVYGYRSVRRDRRVTRKYLGAGEVAVLAEQFAESERAEKRAAREASQRAVRATIAQLEAPGWWTSRFSERIEPLFKRAMKYCGYYVHKRQWRRGGGRG
jgi:hypothetical protein